MAAARGFVVSRQPVMGSMVVYGSAYGLLGHRPPSWTPNPPTIENYLYVFTGHVPQAYEVRGLLRSPITQEAPQLPIGFVNSLVVALGVVTLNLLLGMLAAYTFRESGSADAKPPTRSCSAAACCPRWQSQSRSS